MKIKTLLHKLEIVAKQALEKISDLKVKKLLHKLEIVA